MCNARLWHGMPRHGHARQTHRLQPGRLATVSTVQSENNTHLYWLCVREQTSYGVTASIDTAAKDSQLQSGAL
jgi:hypothetical protein